MIASQDEALRRRTFLFGCSAEVLIPLAVMLIVSLYLLLAE
jgi:hypothetical protein